MSSNNEIPSNRNTASSASGHTGRSMDWRYGDNVQQKSNEGRSPAFIKFIRRYESKFFLETCGRDRLFYFGCS